MSYKTETVSRQANTTKTVSHQANTSERATHSTRYYISDLDCKVSRSLTPAKPLSQEAQDAIAQYMWQMQHYNDGVRVMTPNGRALVARMPASYDPPSSFQSVPKRDIHTRKRWGDE
jgi:hypothetical protein